MHSEKDLPKQTSVIVRTTEWFADLALLNLIWLIISIPLISLLPATVSIFFMINKRYNENEKISVKKYLAHFKDNFIKSYKENWIILVLALLFGMDFFVFESSSFFPEWLSIISISLTILFILLTLLTLYFFSVSQCLQEKILNKWLISFYLLLKYPLISLATLVLISLIIIIFMFFPALIFFFSISLPALISTIAVNKGLEKKSIL